MGERRDNAQIRVRACFRQWLRFESVRRGMTVFELLEVLALESQSAGAVRRILSLAQINHPKSKTLPRAKVAAALSTKDTGRVVHVPAGKRPWDAEGFGQDHDYGLGRFKKGKRKNG